MAFVRASDHGTVARRKVPTYGSEAGWRPHRREGRRCLGLDTAGSACNPTMPVFRPSQLERLAGVTGEVATVLSVRALALAYTLQSIATGI